MSRLYILLAALLLCAGCASVPVIAPEVANDLPDSSVAAAFYMEGKKINYDEMVYKVLWNETRSQESVFKGSWDIDTDVTKTFSNSLESIGLSSKPLYGVLPDELQSEFEQAVLNTRGADGLNVPMSMSDTLRDALERNGIDYVLLLRATDYNVQKYSGFAPTYRMPTWLIVYDVSKNTQQFARGFPLGGNIAVEESPREVEANGLAKLKTATHAWVRTATTSLMPEALGLTAATY